MLLLGNTARRVRESNGLTQKAAADVLGITPVHLCNIEKNKSEPSAKLVAKFKDLWGIDLHILAWCLYGDPEELPEPMRAPMRELGKAWAAQLEGLVPRKENG